MTIKLCIKLFSRTLVIVTMLKKKENTISKRFKELLNGLVNLSIAEQEEKLKSFYEQWKGNGFQTDDVTFLGVRV